MMMYETIEGTYLIQTLHASTCESVTKDLLVQSITHTELIHKETYSNQMNITVMLRI